MVKTHFGRQWSYENDHYNEFYDLLFDQLLIHIQKIQFNYIIENYLIGSTNNIYKTKEAHSLFWLYRVDRKIINSTTIYSFRFPNACNPEFYRIFETKAHNRFSEVNLPRHHYEGWYRYCGKYLLNTIDRYLNIKYVKSF